MLTTKELNRKIDALGKKTAKWRDDVQVVLVACAARAYDDAHRDVDGFTRLVHKMQGADMATLVRWVVKHAPANWNPKAESPYGLGAFSLNKSFKEHFDGIELLAMPWWENARKPAEVPEQFDIDAAILSLVHRAAAAQKKGLPIVGSGPMAEMVAKVAKVEIKKAKAA